SKLTWNLAILRLGRACPDVLSGQNGRRRWRGVSTRKPTTTSVLRTSYSRFGVERSGSTSLTRAVICWKDLLFLRAFGAEQRPQRELQSPHNFLSNINQSVACDAILLVTHQILWMATSFRMQQAQMAKQRKKGGMSSVRAVDRAIAILQCFTADQPAMSVIEIQKRVGLSRPTLYRLLHTLSTRGLTQAEGDPQRFKLAHGVMKLSHVWLKGLEVVTVARPILEE